MRVSDGMRQQRRRGGERTWSGRERDWGRQQHRYCLISAAILKTGQQEQLCGRGESESPAPHLASPRLEHTHPR